MKKMALISLILLFSCKGNEEGKKNKNEAKFYNFEIEDSNESYIMTEWSDDKKKFYYNKIAELISLDLRRYNIRTITNKSFQSSIKDKLGIEVSNKDYQILPYSLFETDSLDGTIPQIIIFKRNNIISFNNSLPLINNASLKYYETKDYLDLDNSNSKEVLMNKIILNYDLNNLKKHSEYEFLMEYLIYSYHFSNDFDFLKKIIKKIIDDNKHKLNYHPEKLLQILFYRDKYKLDEEFFKKIVEIDTDHILEKRFVEALEEKKSKLKIVNIENIKNKVNELYNEQIKPSSVSKLIVHDLNNDRVKDSILVDRNNDSYIFLSDTRMKVILKNTKLLNVTNQCPNDPLSKIVVKNEFVTFEKYNCNNSNFIYSYITFDVIADKAYLYKYSEEYTDIHNPDKVIQNRIWTNKDFGDVKFEDVTEDFLINLTQNGPKKN